MEGIGVVMPVENDMKKPQHFLGCPGVLNTAMITVVVLYAVIGFFGYVRFGDEVKGTVVDSIFVFLNFSFLYLWIYRQRYSKFTRGSYVRNLRHTI